MTDLEQLAARVEAGSGEDHDLVRAIFRQLHSRTGYPSLAVPVENAINQDCVSAAVKVLERSLPSANCHGYEKDETGSCDAHVSRNGFGRDDAWIHQGHALSPARALLAAALRALAAQEPKP